MVADSCSLPKCADYQNLRHMTDVLLGGVRLDWNVFSKIVEVSAGEADPHTGGDAKTERISLEISSTDMVTMVFSSAEVSGTVRRTSQEQLSEKERVS